MGEMCERDAGGLWADCLIVGAIVGSCCWVLGLFCHSDLPTGRQGDSEESHPTAHMLNSYLFIKNE